jgi:hypothetical protein
MRTLPLSPGDNSTDSREKKWIHRITTIGTHNLAIGRQPQSGRHWNARPENLKTASSFGLNDSIQRMRFFSIENG